MVASNEFGDFNNLKINLCFFLSSCNPSKSDMLNEKKEISEPETNAEKNSKITIKTRTSKFSK